MRYRVNRIKIAWKKAEANVAVGACAADSKSAREAKRSMITVISPVSARITSIASWTSNLFRKVLKIHLPPKQ